MDPKFCRTKENIYSFVSGTVSLVLNEVLFLVICAGQEIYFDYFPYCSLFSDKTKILFSKIKMILVVYLNLVWIQRDNFCFQVSFNTNFLRPFVGQPKYASLASALKQRHWNSVLEADNTGTCLHLCFSVGRIKTKSHYQSACHKCNTASFFLSWKIAI